MEVVITALGPDNVGLADPIIHYVTGQGARIAEIQMYDHDEEHLFAMLCRISIDATHFDMLKSAMRQIGEHTKLAIRVWSPDHHPIPKLAICCTYVEHTPRAVLEAIQNGTIKAEASVILSNRKKLSKLAEEFEVPFHQIGDSTGAADDQRNGPVDRPIRRRLRDPGPLHASASAGHLLAVRRWPNHQFASWVATRLSRLPALPRCIRRPNVDLWARPVTLSFPNSMPATKRSISARSASILGTDLESIIARGESENEPACLAEGVRRVVDREVQLHFHRVTARVR